MRKPIHVIARRTLLACLLLGEGAIESALAADLIVPADYLTIQSAIDAAAVGDTIRIARGDYYEQLLITDKTLTLMGEPGAVLHATADMAQTLLPGNTLRPLLGILRSDVTLTGLTFAGDEMGSAYSSGALQGVFFVGSGGKVENCIFRDFRGSTLTEYSSARALIVWNPITFGGPSQINIVISGNTFQGNEGTITIAGDDGSNPTLLRTRFTIEGNTVVGLGPADIAVDGIAILTGASGVVRSNTISNFQYTGAETFPYSSGITAYDGLARNRNPARAEPLQALRFEANTFTNNDEHLVVLGAPRAEIVNNIFNGSGPVAPRWGGVAISGTNVVVANNDFADMPTGIFLFGNDLYFDNWPAVGIAHNAKLTGNWFSGVAQPVRIHPLVTGLQQDGTEFPPLRPSFQSIQSLSGGGAALTVRSWHTQSAVIEASADFQNWAPVHTNRNALPIFNYEDSAAAAGQHRFYRARLP